MNPLRAISGEVRAEAYRQAHTNGDHRACDKTSCPEWVAELVACPEYQPALDRWSAK